MTNTLEDGLGASASTGFFSGFLSTPLFFSDFFASAFDSFSFRCSLFVDLSLSFVTFGEVFFSSSLELVSDDDEEDEDFDDLLELELVVRDVI